MKTTLSATQWQKLQQLFDQTESLDRNSADVLIASTRIEDAFVADALSAMLDAHHQWQLRTGAALDNLVETGTVTSVGMQIGPYRLVREIGRGGMGVVYLGERSDGQVQQQVAIKVLHAQHLDVNTHARFRREREILAAFDHPGIARLLDAGESSAGEPYYVMEYLRGLPIDAHCDQRRLGIRERLKLFQGVCDAVQYAHAQLILHRDIKASNIIVDAAGVPKLIDFGIAKPIHLHDAESAQQTATHQRYFSPVNAAPEQIRGGVVAVTCDVYQLGTLLHELLTGKPIFDLHAISAAELERNICTVIPTPPSVIAATAVESTTQTRALSTAQALARALRGDLDAIVQRAVRKEPHMRYASVDQLSQDIERHLHDQPVHGRRGNRAYRFSRFVKRHWRGLGVALAAVIAVFVFTLLLYQQILRTKAERDRAIEASSRAETATGFLLDVFRTGDPAVSKKSQISIGEALQWAVPVLESKLSDQPVFRAQITETLAEVYRSLGDLDQSAKLHAQSLAILDSMPSPPKGMLIGQLQRSIVVLMDRAQYSAAEALARRLIEMDPIVATHPFSNWRTQIVQSRVIAHKDRAASCRLLAQLAAGLNSVAGQYAEAFASTQLNLAKCAEQEEASTRIVADDLSRASVLVARHLGSDHVLLIDLKQTLARLRIRQNRRAEATELFNEVLVVQERIYGASSITVADTLMETGMMNLSNANYGDAKRDLLRAQSIYSTAYGGIEVERKAVVAHRLGKVYETGFDDHYHALQWYGIAFQTGNAAFAPNSSDLGAFATSFGAMLWRTGSLAEAESVLRTARKLTSARESDGVRARLTLAAMAARNNHWKEVAELIAECQSGDSRILEDKAFAAELSALQAGLAKNQTR
jgi:eukaryotic-like serine/threonine-protein kinase